MTRDSIRPACNSCSAQCVSFILIESELLEHVLGMGTHFPSGPMDCARCPSESRNDTGHRHLTTQYSVVNPLHRSSRQILRVIDHIRSSADESVGYSCGRENLVERHEVQRVRFCLASCRVQPRSDPIVSGQARPRGRRIGPNTSPPKLFLERSVVSGPGPR
jgi:hypothetical protein